MDLIKLAEKKAKQNNVKLVVCESWDEKCMHAVSMILKEKLAKVILLGNPDKIKKTAEKLKADISKAEIVDFKKSELRKQLAEKLYELRKHKGIDLKQAEKLMDNINYFACMYAYAGYADAVAGSAICSTAEFMKPALQILRKKNTLVSEVTVLDDVKNNRILFAGDFSLNIDPNAEQLASIALNTAECAETFETKPKIALLSFSTKGSGGDLDMFKPIRKAVEIIRKNNPKIIVDGELQLDAALDKFAAKKKCPDSPIKGDANVLIFPNLTASNIFAHALLQLTDVKMIFTMLMGMQKPVIVLGRSTPAEVKRNMMLGCIVEAIK